jgi:hypothetical protein
MKLNDIKKKILCENYRDLGVRDEGGGRCGVCLCSQRILVFGEIHICGKIRLISIRGLVLDGA